MRTFIPLVLSCASVLGADTGIRLVTTAKTNAETASISTKDTFTRDGRTNLVRSSKTKAGVVQLRMHRFYHAGILVGDFVAMPESSGLTTEAGSPYSMGFEFDASHRPKSAVIGTKDGVVLDAFTCTNGVFTPADSAVIQKANALSGDMTPMLDPDHVRKTSPHDFGREVEKLIEKHKDK